MRIPVKFYVPILLVLVVVGAGAVVAHWRLSTDRSKTVEFSVAVIGGLTALYGLLLGIHQGRSTSATRFMQRWNAPEFRPYRKAIRQTIDDGNPDAVDRLDTAFILDFWEEMSIAVLAKEADEGLLKQFFYSAVVRYYLSTEKYVRDLRNKAGQPSGYKGFWDLAQRWANTASPTP